MTDTLARMSELRTVLYERLKQAFDNGILEPHEQAELKQLYGLGKLTLDDVRSVFGAFLKDEWNKAMADGVLTEDERAKLEKIVTQLKLPSDLVPDDVKRALGR